MNMHNWIERIISAEQRFALPIMTYPGLELTGHTITDIISNGEAQFECIAAIARRYPTLAAVTTMDLSVEAQCFGSPISFSESEVPTVSGKIVEDEESIRALRVPEVGSGRTPVYLRAAELAAQEITDRPVFGGLIGPFSLAGRLFDFTEIMMACLTEPHVVHQLLDKATAFILSYAKAFKATGVNGLIIAEPAAGLLSPAQADSFSSQYIKRIVEAVQDEEFAVLLHNCGNTKMLMKSMLSTDARMLHFGNAVDLADILPQVPSSIPVCGNIDPAGVFRRGTPETMKSAVEALLEKTKEYPNYILSSGCDIPPGTPLENVDAFFEALASYNTQRALSELCAIK